MHKKIVADENMPALSLFSEHGDVTTVAGRNMSNQQLQQANTLLVRSITQVNKALLAGTPVRFVGSATIGTDHVDLAWLRQQGIGFAHAPGCNAMAVAEYVLQAVVVWLLERNQQPQDATLAIIGHGNVGARVATLCSALGVQVKLVDPLSQKLTHSYYPLDDVLQADIISCHVPLTREEQHATYHLFDDKRLQQLRPEQLLINTSRGAVVDNQALKQLLQRGEGPTAWLDVWEGEPSIDAELLALVRMGTPHIAGYTVEGKWRGTWMLYQAWREFYQLKSEAEDEALPQLAPKRIWSADIQSLEEVSQLLQAYYPMVDDFKRLQKSLSAKNSAQAFDDLRRDYGQRFELAGVVCEGEVAPQWQPLFSLLGIVCAG